MKRTLFASCFMLIHGYACISQTTFVKSVEALKMQLQKSKPDTSGINLLLQISNTYFSGDKKMPHDLDSAIVYASRAESLSRSLKNDPELGNSYLLLAKISAEQQKLNEGKIFAQKAIDIFSKTGSGKKLADGYIALSNNYETYDSGLIEKIRLDRMAAVIYRQEHDKENEAASLKDLGKTLMFQGKMDEALEILKQSLSIYDSIKYEQVQEVYSLIGVNYTQLGNYQQGIQFGLKAVNTAEKFKDTSKATGVLYNYLAVTYDKLNQTANASIYLKKALKIAENGDDLPLIVMLVTNIAHISLKLNNPKEALLFLNGLVKKYPNLSDRFALTQINSLYLRVYLKLKDYKTAGPYCEKLLALSRQYAADDPSQVAIYPYVSSYYLQTKGFDKALKYLSLYKGIAEKKNLVSDLKSVHLLWYMLDSATGNLSSAIEHYKLYKTFNDTLFNETESKQIAQLQIQFNTEKKDSDITQLTRQAIFQKKELQQATLLKNYTLAGIALLIIIMGLLYNRYLIKQKNNLKLEKKQKEINEQNISLQRLVDEKQWLLKEIHHRVKNNLQIVMSLLNSQSAYLQNDAALSAIQESQHRVQAMSLLHQKLYNSENVSAIDMPAYILELVQYLRDSFKTGQRIRFETNVDSLELDICQAVPVGLILNEAITNSIKYAFPDDREGIIKISLLKTKAEHYLLTIADNGIGIPVNFTASRQGSLGMSLMHGLSEDLDGTFTIENNNGTALKISFLQDIPIKRMDTVNIAG